MRKIWIRISPYVIGLIAPILFAAWAATVSEKTKGTLLICLAVHFLLTAAVDVISARTGMKRALRFSLQLWLNLLHVLHSLILLLGGIIKEKLYYHGKKNYGQSVRTGEAL